MTFSWKALAAGAAALGLIASGATALGSRTASAQPTPPTRFFGTVSGVTPVEGARVTALVGTTVCSDTAQGVVSAGSYFVDVKSATTQPGCGTDGADVSFTITPAGGT